MVVHILCPECGEDIADIFPFWNLVKNSYCKQTLKEYKYVIDVENADLKDDILLEFAFILEALRINNECCRAHIIGNTDFDSLYI
jgi:DNA-directed RNA polymerase subunit N (RpoN/RPB10)